MVLFAKRGRGQFSPRAQGVVPSPAGTADVCKRYRLVALVPINPVLSDHRLGASDRNRHE